MKARGYSLIELMVGISMLVVIVGMGIPSFRTTILNNRMSAQVNDFIVMLTYARSEAIKRNASVSVCKSENQTACASDATWADGWIVWVDANGGDGVLDNGEVILRKGSALEGNNSLTASTDVTTFTATGFVTAATSFVTCDSRGEDHARVIVLNLSGRPKSADYDASGDAPTCS